MARNDVEAFTIADKVVDPGTSRDVAIPITTMATGTESALMVRVLHGAKPGPVVFVSGAIHGDEITGTAVIQRVALELSPEKLSGTLLLIPVSNIFGFFTHSRYLPDRRDLNRSFPGSATGSLAGQLAHVFFREIISRASLGIDIHSAAEHRYNLPQIRIDAGNKRLVDLAMAFGAPVIIEAPLRDGSLRSLAKTEGVDMLLLEAGEGLRFDDFSVETGASGVKRVLAYLGMIEADDSTACTVTPARSKSTHWVRSPRGGVMHRAKSSGDPVHKGDLLATIVGLFGEDPVAVTADSDGIIIGHATLPVVHQGDALFHIASVRNPDRVGQSIEGMTEALAESEPEGLAEALLDEDEVL